MTTQLRIFIIANAMWLSGCASSALPKPDLASLPDADDHPGEGAVVVFDNTTVTYGLDDKGELIADVTHHRRVRLLRESGRKHMAVTAFYDREWNELTAFDGRVTYPDGESRVLERESAIDTMVAPGFVLFDSTRVVAFSLDSIPVGSVVESKHTTRYFKPALFQFGTCFGERFPVARTSLEARAPKGWEIEHVVRRLNADVDLFPTESTAGDQRTLRWEQKDLEEVDTYRHGPDFRFVVPCVGVRIKRWASGGTVRTAFEDTPRLSQWMHELAEPRLEVTDAIHRKKDEILAGASADKRERAARLYTWVRDNISYCAIEVGIGGLQPHSSAETFEVGYGDCKDKANLLRGLLAADGIDSRLASIYAHDGYPRRFALPTVSGNFNHMILVIDLPEGPVVVDPTTRVVPFGDLPFGDQDADLLPASRVGDELMHTSLAEPARNGHRRYHVATLDATGDSIDTVDFEARGEDARRYRGSFLRTTLEQRREVVARLWSLAEREVTDVALENEGPQLDPVPVKGKVRIEREHVAMGEGNTRLLQLNDLLERPLPDIRSFQRDDVPVMLGHPRADHDEVSLVVPAQLAVEHVPAPVEIDCDEVSYRLRYEVEGPRVRIVRDVVVKRTVLEKARFKPFKKVYRKMMRAELAPLVISRFARERPQAPVPPPPPAPPPAPLEGSAP